MTEAPLRVVISHTVTCYRRPAERSMSMWARWILGHTTEEVDQRRLGRTWDLTYLTTVSSLYSIIRYNTAQYKDNLCIYSNQLIKTLERHLAAMVDVFRSPTEICSSLVSCSVGMTQYQCLYIGFSSCDKPLRCISMLPPSSQELNVLQTGRLDWYPFGAMERFPPTPMADFGQFRFVRRSSRPNHEAPRSPSSPI